MSNHQSAIELIKALSGQANILTIPRLYIDYMGSIDGGLLLNQLIYWSDKGSDSDDWFYKTYLEWEEETTLSKYEVSKQANILKEKGVLKTNVKKANGAPTVHYKFLFSEFQNSIVEFIDYRKSINFTINSEETRQSLTETTSEITTEITKASSANADYSRPVSLLSEKEIKTLKLPLSTWKEYLADEQAERGRKGVIKFLESKIAIGPLLPDTDEARYLFGRLGTEAEALGRNGPQKFPSLACKEKFNRAVKQLNGTFEAAVNGGLEAGILGIPRLVQYISSSKWKEGKNGRTRAEGTEGTSKGGPAGVNGETQDFEPPEGSGQTPEMYARLRAAFAPKPG